MASPANYVDYLGTRIGTFQVIGRAPIRRRANGKPLPSEWWLRCRCGKVRTVQTCQIKNARLRCKRCGERSASEEAAAKLRPRTGIAELLALIAPSGPGLTLAEALAEATSARSVRSAG